MQFTIADSITDGMSLVEVTARLAQHTVISGVVWLGTTGTAQHTAHSDYDLLLVVRELPEPIYVIFTTIDGVWSDIIFVQQSAIAEMLAAADLTALSPERGDLMYWLAMGTIQHDADGLLAQVQQRLHTTEWRQSVSEHAVFAAWRKINYNFAQTRRMLAADDGVYETAVAMRLLYMVPEVYVAYFQARGLKWDGEKAAVRYWQVHDPDFLALLRQFTIVGDVAEQFALYQQMARRALQPVGGLWSTPPVSVSLTYPTSTLEDHERAVAFWETLLRE